jgi:hypothetical protein
VKTLSENNRLIVCLDYEIPPASTNYRELYPNCLLYYYLLEPQFSYNPQ